MSTYNRSAQSAAFISTMGKWLNPLKRVGWNYLSITKLQRCNRCSLGIDKLCHFTRYNGCNYLTMMGLKLNRVNKRRHKAQYSLPNLSSLHWRHNGHDSVSNHRPHDCLLNRLFRSKKISKLRVTGLCVGNSPESGEFPAQMASDAENVSIWWRH